MEQVALRLEGGGGWTYLGGRADARKPVEVVLRAFDEDVEFATGPDAERPGDDSVVVPTGEGRRLAGLHFFTRAAHACRVSTRGL